VLSLDTRSAGLGFVTGGFGLVALLFLGATLAAARPGWIAGVLALLALLYFGRLSVAGEPSLEGLGIVSVLLLLTGELSQWSMDSRHAGSYETGVHLWRAAGIVVLGLLGLGTVLLSQVATGVPIAGGIGTVAVAMVAAVALLGLISAVALRRPDRPAVPYDSREAP
jgi:hypothetical protein